MAPFSDTRSGFRLPDRALDRARALPRAPAAARWRTAGALLAAGVVAAACRDAPGDPMAMVLTEETRSALSLPTELPTLADLARRAGGEDVLGAAVPLWTDSWNRRVDQGRAAREEAYDMAAAPLAELLGDEGIHELRVEVDGALTASAPLLQGDLSSDLEAGVLRARLLRDEAAAAFGEDRLVEAVHGLLGASDALRELGPPVVARALLALAEEALPGDGLSETDRKRGEHLVLGARLALDDGDWQVAVRRAYYACQVLGVSPR